jgi:hypothetical protein
VAALDKTAGSLRGRQVVLAAREGPFQMDLPDSPVEMFVLLTNTHDGSGAVTAAVTPGPGGLHEHPAGH